MNKRFRPPIPLLVTAVILLIAGLIYNSLMDTFSEKALQNLLVHAVPFIAIFVSILLFYIALINMLSRAFSGYISTRTYKPIFTASVVGIVLGIVMMFQPFALIIYQVGFYILLFSLLIFMIVSHITPRPLNADGV